MNGQAFAKKRVWRLNHEISHNQSRNSDNILFGSVLQRTKSRIYAPKGGYSPFFMREYRLIEENPIPVYLKNGFYSDLAINPYRLYRNGKLIKEEYQGYFDFDIEKRKKELTIFSRRSMLRLKNKLFAYVNTFSTKIHFQTVTFNQKFDSKIYLKVLNNWLTYQRKYYEKKNKKFSYIWVSEVTKRGVVHFHIFTNWSLPDVRLHNKVLCNIMQNHGALYKTTGSPLHHKKTNGNLSQLTNYLLKYAVKSQLSYVRKWHCSRDVSKFYTGIRLPENPFYLMDKVNKPKLTHVNENGIKQNDVLYFKYHGNLGSLYAPLRVANMLIAKFYPDIPTHSEIEDLIIKKFPNLVPEFTNHNLIEYS